MLQVLKPPWQYRCTANTFSFNSVPAKAEEATMVFVHCTCYYATLDGLQTHCLLTLPTTQSIQNAGESWGISSRHEVKWFSVGSILYDSVGHVRETSRIQHGHRHFCHGLQHEVISETSGNSRISFESFTTPQIFPTSVTSGIRNGGLYARQLYSACIVRHGSNI